ALLGERRVALDNARAHPGARLVRLFGVLGELQRRAAMPDGEVGAAERAVLALHQLVLQRSFVHSVHEVERAWPQLDGVVVLAVAIGAGHRGEAGEYGNRGHECGREQDSAHGSLLELATRCARVRPRTGCYDAGIKAT